MHAMHEQWKWHFQQFYNSGKRCDVGRFGVRAAKSDSVCRVIVAESLLNIRHLEAGFIGTCAVFAQTQKEARNRLLTIRAVLSSCGFTEASAKKLGPLQMSTAADCVSLSDSQGHSIAFQVFTASVAGAVGFTGISAFGDEVDLWGGGEAANPCAQVVSTLASRFVTQPGACFHLLSASYPDRPPSYFDEMIALGDTPLQYVARLGKVAAASDFEQRTELAARTGLTDPLLVGPELPVDCRDIPCWTSNPIASLQDCYSTTDGTPKGVHSMLIRSGGHSEKTDGDNARTCGDFTGLCEAVTHLNRGDAGRPYFANLPYWDPYSAHNDPRDNRSL
jgi:hypothetical protein